MLTPLKFNVPEFVLVRAPVVVVPVAPANVNVTPVGTSIVPVLLAFIVNALFDVAVEPVYCKVPPSKTKLVAVLVAAPRFPVAPPSPIVPTLIVPVLIVVTPEYVFEPVNVKTEDDEPLYKFPAPLITPVCKVWFVLDKYLNVVPDPIEMSFE